MQTQQEKKQHSKQMIFLFFLSQSITLFGSTLVQMAVVWYATLYTSSGIWVAAFSVCSYLPQFSEIISRRRVGGQVQPETPDHGSGSGDRGCRRLLGIHIFATASGTEDSWL